MQSLAKEVKQELTGRIVPFWEGLRDEEYGGFYGYQDFDLNVQKTYEKGCILNSRILWFFSNAYLTLKDEKLRADAEHAYRFMKQACVDREYGYLEAFTRDFKPESNEKLSENGVMAEKTMNTLLHVFEAYTELYRVTKDPFTGDRLRFMMDLFADKVYNKEKGRQEVFFDRTWNTLIDLYSYGHDIETSWLIDRGTEVLGDPAYREKLLPITGEIAENIYNTAYKNHSLMNECERGVDDTTRVWWVQAEAVVGFLNAWQKKPEETKYLDAAKDIWGYIKEYVIDKREGSEWFWCVNADGSPIHEPIVEPWKCPYHNGRMCMEVIGRLKDAE